MNVQDVMTRSPRTCRGSDSLVSAAKVLWDHDCGAVPVVDDVGRPIGIVTDRDCCMAVYTRGLRLDEIPVAAAMARTLFTVRADEPVTSAMATMQHKQVRRLPVVDGQGKLCGIVSSADLLVRAARVAGVTETLAAIAAPRAVTAAVSEGRREAATVMVPKAPTSTGLSSAPSPSASAPATASPVAAPGKAVAGGGNAGSAGKNGGKSNGKRK